MKKITLLLFIFYGCCFSQNFKSEVFSTMGITGRLTTEIKVKDSTLHIISLVNKKKDTSSYDIIRKNKRMIYFTDGVKTHSYSWGPYEGKIKRFKHTHVANITFDNISGSISNLYYCVEN